MYDVATRPNIIGVRDLRRHLSVHLDRVKDGQTLVITAHGEPVAELRPLPVYADQLRRLIARGWVTPARRSPSALPRPLKVKLRRPISAWLAEQREDVL